MNHIRSHLLAAALCLCGIFSCVTAARAADASLQQSRSATQAMDPASTFANATEKAEVQAFIHRLWTLIRAQRRARSALITSQRRAIRNGDMAAFRKGTLAYAHTIESVAATLDSLNSPTVSDADGEKGMDLALINAQTAADAERATAKNAMRELDACRQIACMKPARFDIEADRSNREAVLFLRQTYAVYGYRLRDVEPRTLTLRPGAKPSPYVTTDGS